VTQPNLQQTHFNSARASLRQALSWYSHIRRQPRVAQDSQLQTAIGKQLEVLSANLAKLDSNVIRIAAFGLVSRGKSAVLNGLMGQKILQTGPINGVTQWPRSIRWTPEDGKVQVELIDTPGLDEVEGETRAQMAKEVARQADLILFVVAGDITRTEYRALCELRQTRKPLILVFNKIDLYPEQDRQAIIAQLRQLAEGDRSVSTPDDIVLVAAEPAPVSVRVEWPDDKITYEWETPEPQVEELKLKILEILNREGHSLLALNALMQAQEAQATIAEQTLQAQNKPAEELIWKFAKYKALAVGLNPIAFLDLLGGIITDLVLIRSLARLYGLPMTGYQAGKLWKSIVFSAGGLIFAELGSSLVFGISKSAGVAAGMAGDGVGLTTYAGAAVAQASLAGYGAYLVGQAAQTYLEQGCTWGPMGPDTVIQEILNQAETDTIIARLRQELSSQ
jgi:small GTP-binding protein